MSTTSAIPNISLSWCICIECETVWVFKGNNKNSQGSGHNNTYCVYYVLYALPHSVSRKESEYHSSGLFNSTYVYCCILWCLWMHPLQPAISIHPLDLQLYARMGFILGTSLSPKVSHVVQECISCVYNTWASSMHIKTRNGRESTQRESREMEPLRFLAAAVMLSIILSGTIGNL